MHRPSRSCAQVIAAVLAPLTGLGCANMPMTRTGFLADYDQLQPAPERTVAFVPDGIELYVGDGLRSGERYDAVLIEPVVYRPIEGNDYEPSQATADDLSRYFGRKLHEILGDGFEIVDAPRAGAARVKVAITALDTSNVPINVITVILLFPFDMGGISGEVEISDSITGEPLAAMTLCRGGTPFLLIECFNRHGHACHGMKKWAREIRRLLIESWDARPVARDGSGSRESVLQDP